MSEHRTMTMASAPLHLGKRVFQASPLDDKDIAEMDEWVRSTHIQNARASLTPQNTQAEREETLGIAMRQALAMSWMSGEGARLIGTVAGMTRLMWQTIKKNHPDVTEDDLRQLMLSKENIDEANRVFRTVNNLNEKKGTKVVPPRPSHRAKRKSTKR